MTIKGTVTPEYKITYDTSSVSKIASTNNDYTISFDSTSMVDNPNSTITYNSTPITITTDPDPFGVEWTRKTFDKWPSEVVIDDMITKYPGLRLQYEKFMTVYNLVKDDYTYEEPVNDGSI